MSAKDAQELPQIPELEADYELVRELGRGGTAIVYLARDRELGRYVAIKLIRPAYVEDDDAAARLVREARTVGKLQHPNIVMILGARRLAGRELALVLQYVPGITLKQRIRTEGALPCADVERILLDLGSALAYAHGLRIVHRDIKPENVYLDEESGVARLADFGIARVWDSEAGMTLPGTALGTPSYMSPEQVDGQDVDGRSDLYSLGLVGYEMLTGETPWAGEGLYNIIYKQKHEELPPLAERCPDLPERLRVAIEGALKKAPDQRWRDATQFLAALRGDTASPASAASAAVGQDHPQTDPPVTAGLEDQHTILYRPPPPDADPDTGAADPAAPAASAADPVAPWPDEPGPASGSRPPAWLRGRKARHRTGKYGPLWGRGAAPDWPDGEFDDDGEPAEARAPHGARRRRLLPLVVMLGLLLLAAGSIEVLSGEGYVRPLVTSARPVMDGYIRTVLAQLRSNADELGAGGAPRPGATGPAGADSDDPGLPYAASRPAELQILGGPVRTGPPGATLPGPVVVQVVNARGEGVPDVPVSFEIATGGGSVEPAEAVTGEEGIVQARWTLGGSEGRQRLLAAVAGAHDPALIAEVIAEAGGEILADAQQEPEPQDSPDLTPTDARPAPDAPAEAPAAPATIELVRGSNQIGRTGATLPGQLEVRVMDDRRRPVPNVGVRFAVVEGGGTVAPTFAETDANGVARAGWTLGPHEGPQLAHAFVDALPSLEVRFPADIAPTRLAIQPLVTAGGVHSCSLAPDGGLTCWGSNESGQLGDGTRSRQLEPGFNVAGGPFAAVAAGVTHTCALTMTGQLSCWGMNGAGQLGDGTTASRVLPAAVTGDRRFVAVSAGLSHTCALTASGAAFCWGANRYGELGDGSTDRATLPVRVRVEPTLGFRQIAVGWRHTCALDMQGTAYCWGSNQSGELGAPGAPPSSSPIAVAGGHRFRSLSAGSAHTCGVTEQGRILCWGENDSGQLGDGTRERRSSPTPIAGTETFASVVAGGVHSCGLTANGNVRCWGDNSYGQLGDGSTDGRLTPVAAAGDLGFSQIHAVGSHTCGRTPTGNVFCWGYNVEGQLGDGTRDDRSRPTAVVRGRQ